MHSVRATRRSSKGVERAIKQRDLQKTATHRRHYGALSTADPLKSLSCFFQPHLLPFAVPSAVVMQFVVFRSLVARDVEDEAALEKDAVAGKGGVVWALVWLHCMALLMVRLM